MRFSEIGFKSAYFWKSVRARLQPCRKRPVKTGALAPEDPSVFARRATERIFETRGSLLLPILIVAAAAGGWAQGPAYHLGKTPSEETIRAWDIAVGPEGKELPPGSGTAKEGAKIYAQKCAACHGPTGTEGPARRLVGGRGTLHTPNPVRTVGSFWPFATTVWSYINASMPQLQEGSLSADEVYALTAVLLYWNGIIGESDRLDEKTLPKIQRPNRNGFVPARPDYQQYQACNPNLLRCAESLAAE